MKRYADKSILFVLRLVFIATVCRTFQDNSLLQRARSSLRVHRFQLLRELCEDDRQGRMYRATVAVLR